MLMKTRAQRARPCDKLFLRGRLGDSSPLRAGYAITADRDVRDVLPAGAIRKPCRPLNK